MTNTWMATLAVAYIVAGIVSTAAYVPTIKDLWLHKRKSANIPSYILWTITGAISFLYVMIAVPDLLLQIVTGLSFTACAVILVLSLALHKK